MGRFSRKGNKVYFWCRFWPGSTFSVGGFKTKLKGAKFLTTGKKIDFEQIGNRIKFKKLPKTSPDKLAGITVMELDFASKPTFVWCADSAVFQTMTVNTRW